MYSGYCNICTDDKTLIGITYGCNSVLVMENNIMYRSWADMLNALYKNLFNSRCDLSEIRITYYYMDVPVTIFKIGYNKGLVIYNDENYIRAYSISPQHAVVDLAYCKIIENNKSNMEIIKNPFLDNVNIYENKNSKNVDKNNNSIAVDTKETKNNNIRHKTFLEKAKIKTQEKTEKIAKYNDNKNVKKQEETKQQPQENIKELKLVNDMQPKEKIRIFESDKTCYTKIKHDIEKGSIKIENINPCFKVKYLVFKVLESRNSINFTNNDNINAEFDLFNTLYDECNKNSQEKCCSKQKIYIPHNYQYMSNDKKEEYARKYKMTLKQFEDKYINGIIDDDLIENHINKIPKTHEKQDVASDGDASSSDSENSDFNSSDKPKIDTNFTNLISEYNK